MVVFTDLSDQALSTECADVAETAVIIEQLRKMGVQVKNWVLQAIKVLLAISVIVQERVPWAWRWSVDRTAVLHE